ncbi:hypothetical protein CEXT_57151 [Caerostris extrusa]|uniref:Uncharacterized protein n=1 Tax=Caerostris extrusa TaxID=172846 RepID=A0AAV4MCS9_CAEEX|nr:hypothetical protein CEXT_57151 [Caerostris extrusa]
MRGDVNHPGIFIARGGRAKEVTEVEILWCHCREKGKKIIERGKYEKRGDSLVQHDKEAVNDHDEEEGSHFLKRQVRSPRFLAGL